MRRRLFLGGFFALTGSVTSCRTKKQSRKAGFVLVHGAWSGSYLYGKVLPHLAQSGSLAIAIDLPGQGYKSRFPRSFLKRPLDHHAFATERSPIADVTLAEGIETIGEAIHSLIQAGCESVILVGHSSGGISVTAAAEKFYNKISAVVYLAGVVPVSDKSPIELFRTPEGRTSRTSELLFPLDPEKVGALRIDSHIDNVTFRNKSKEILFNDLDLAQTEIILKMQSSDVPFSTLATPIQMSSKKWGTLNKFYVRCNQDLAIPPAFQRLMITTNNSANPNNPMKLFDLDSGHNCPFSKPKEIAEILHSLI
jgi:pimeloyl-ACP methyl ester carboxylesterase